MNSSLKHLSTLSAMPFSAPLAVWADRRSAPAVAQSRPVKFSVVTPTLNAAKYLRECLESIERQRAEGIEIEHLVLDGGSTDGTLQMLEQANVVRVPRTAEDGVIRAMCLGYEAASGDLVSFLGADDVLAPGALAEVQRTWQREQRPLIFCRSRWTDGDLKSLGELAPPPAWLTASIHASLGWNYLGAANSFITPSLYRELGGFDESLRRAEDYEFYTRGLARGVPFSRVNQTVCLYRRHGANISLQRDQSHRQDVERILQQYGPGQALLERIYGTAFRTWVYLRNPSWAGHQLRRKLTERRLRG